MRREELVLDAVKELYQDFDLVAALAKNSYVMKIKVEEHNWFLNYPMGLWITIFLPICFHSVGNYDWNCGKKKNLKKNFGIML